MYNLLNVYPPICATCGQKYLVITVISSIQDYSIRILSGIRQVLGRGLKGNNKLQNGALKDVMSSNA